MKKIQLSIYDILLGLSLVALLSFHPVGAQEVKSTPDQQASPPMPSTFHLEVDQADLAAINNALMELPKKIADPLINKLNGQLQKQMQAAQAAVKPPEPK